MPYTSRPHPLTRRALMTLSTSLCNEKQGHGMTLLTVACETSHIKQATTAAHSPCQARWSRRWTLAGVITTVLLFSLIPVCAILPAEFHHLCGHVAGTFIRSVLPTSYKAREPPCHTEACIRLSQQITDALDTDFDPCEDFYLFSVNGWRKTHPIPPGKSAVHRDLLEVSNHQVVKDILESHSIPSDGEDPGGHDRRLLTQLRDLYHSCMDEAALDSLGSTPLARVIGELRRQMREYGLTDGVLFAQQVMGAHALFTFNIDGDAAKDPDLMVPWIGQADLSLPTKEHYLNEDLVQLYSEIVAEVLADLESDHNTAHSPGATTASFVELAKKVVTLEQEIARISLSLEEIYYHPFERHNRISIRKHELEALFPHIEWWFYLWSMLPPYGPSPEYVIATHPPYFRALSDILNKTSHEVIEALLVNKAALTVAPFLGKTSKVQQARSRLDSFLSGTDPNAPVDRSKFCVGQVEDGMGFAVGRYFVNATYTKAIEQAAANIVNESIRAVQHALATSDWLDAESRLAADKADGIRALLGYPLSPDTRDAAALANYYPLVEINITDFFGSMVTTRTNAAAMISEKQAWPRDKQEWRMIPSESDAYYNPATNQITLPAAMLRSLRTTWPGYLNYGDLGFIVSHELTHGFDSYGGLYDKNGKLSRWWTNETQAAFEHKRRCLAAQYSQYYVLDEHDNKVYVNGTFSSSENIGDSGLIHAYRAWKAQYPASHAAGKEHLLPDHPYTRDQLFFISYAQSWAQSMTPAAAAERVRSNPHPPAQIRVEGTLINIPEFAEAFNCPVGTRLNPPKEERCMFWG